MVQPPLNLLAPHIPLQLPFPSQEALWLPTSSILVSGPSPQPLHGVGITRSRGTQWSHTPPGRVTVPPLKLTVQPLLLLSLSTSRILQIQPHIDSVQTLVRAVDLWTQGIRATLPGRSWWDGHLEALPSPRESASWLSQDPFCLGPPSPPAFCQPWQPLWFQGSQELWVLSRQSPRVVSVKGREQAEGLSTSPTWCFLPPRTATWLKVGRSSCPWSNSVDGSLVTLPGSPITWQLLQTFFTHLEIP